MPVSRYLPMISGVYFLHLYLHMTAALMILSNQDLAVDTMLQLFHMRYDTNQMIGLGQLSQYI